ncbi:MAG: glucodextranase DOMON-like domain-containing protein, partial [Myxococcota bacterium]|nr:glucodextranase DOMON-like domain-containing protein [Myxococcota bacterium]
MAWCLFAGCASASPAITDRLVIGDPAGDDHGPGAYVYPQGEVYGPGALDLREVRLVRDGDAVVIEAVFHRPVTVARGVRLAREQVADLFVATVDVYIDLRRGDGAGSQLGLPGRRVQLPDGVGWDLAVVLSPIPVRLAQALEGHRSVGHWLVPTRVRVRGRTLTARVPASHFEGLPLRDVGLAVAVTGTVFGSTFRTEVDGMVPTAFVREVTERPGRCD